MLGKSIGLYTFLSLHLIAGLCVPGLALAEDKEQIRTLPLEDVQRFTTAISQIKSYYVKPVDDKELFEQAIRGMLKGLDPHSAYLDEEEFSELKASTKGEFSGLGIEVTMDQGLIKVISPIDDSPAASAGIKAGDYIVRIDNKAVKGMTLRQAVSMMRGKTGSSIKLMVLRKGEKKPLMFTVVRNVITVKSVKSKILDDNYGYIRLSHFQEPSARDLKNAVTELQQNSNGQLKGLILDLRNNPGGLLDSAIEISDLFIHNDKKGDEELIVYTKGRIPGAEFKANAKPGDVLQKAPMVVLINEGSASGSEIVAGALKDNKRAILMGTKTFGKGSVQTVLPLDRSRGIKLTTALYYTPSGRSIQAEGIEPDIYVKQTKIGKKPKQEDNTLSQFSEADLLGHLDNGNGASAKKTVKKKNSQTLMYDDYQLYEALNLLKGLALLQKQ